MPLISAYVLPTSRIIEIFRRIQDGQAPERLSIQLLKDWGFTSTNDRAFIPLLKALGFLTADGKPTQRYSDYRDHSRSKQILGLAIREAYGELFLIKEYPTTSDKNAIEGKFKSYHNVSDHVASLMTKTFFALLAIATLPGKPTETTALPPVEPDRPQTDAQTEITSSPTPKIRHAGSAGLHYNIQIHLPPTKDVEVYNAIFKSLKEHLFE